GGPGGTMTQQSHAATPMSQEMQDCIDARMTCHGMCDQTMSHCRQTGGDAPRELTRPLMDCAQTTRRSAHTPLRRSPLPTDTRTLCATACDMCAEACMSMPDDEQMMRCAEACRRWADSCRAMAGATM